MVSLGLLYDSKDAVAWFEYLTGLLPNQSKHLSVNTCDLRTTDSKLPDMVAKSTAIVVLLTPAMIDLLESKAITYDPHLRENVVVLMCYTKPEDYIDRLTNHFVKCKAWNALSIGDNADSSLESDKNMMLELLDIVDQYTPKPPPPKRRKRKCHILPKVITKAGQSVVIMFESEICGSVQIGLKDDDKRYPTEKRNPYTCSFRAPIHKLGSTRLQIFENDEKLADIAFVYRSPILAAFECPVFLAQALGVSSEDKKALDASLVCHFEKTLPGDLLLHNIFKSTKIHHANNDSNVILPTTLHFAAYNGLTELCMVLANSPGAYSAFQIDNCDGNDPADLAENSGHRELAELLRLFFDTQIIIDTCDDMYMEMKRSNDMYCNQTQLSGANDRQPSGIYEDMDAVSRHQAALTNKDKMSLKHSKSTTAENKPAPMHRPLSSSMSAMELMGMTRGTRISPNAGFSRTQQELIDLMKAFKDGTFTIEEVEKLFSNWKEQNNKPSASIKERQKNLQTLRENHSQLFRTVALKKRQPKKKKKMPSTATKEPDQSYASYPTNLAEVESTRFSATSNTSSSSGSRGSCDSYGFCRSDSEGEEDQIRSSPSMRNRPPSVTNRQSLRFVLMGDLQNLSPPSLPPRPPPRQFPPVPISKGSVSVPSVPPRR